MKRLLILQTSAAKNALSIAADEKIRASYELIVLDYSDIVGLKNHVLVSKNTTTDLNTVDKIWLDFDWELADSHTNYHHITRLIIAKMPHKLVLNRRTLEKYHPIYDDKLFVANLLQYSLISHPKTMQLSSTSTFNNKRTVVKKRFSGRARDVYLVHDTAELHPDILKHARDYIYQEYVDIAAEYRVIVYRGKIVAAVQKTSKFQDGITGKVTMTEHIYNLTDEQAALCLATAEAIESELVGIDLATDKGGTNWVIEFNIGAILTAFQRVTGINLLEDVLLGTR